MPEPPIQLEIRRLIQTENGVKVVVVRGQHDAPRVLETPTVAPVEVPQNVVQKQFSPCFLKKNTHQSGSLISRSLKSALLSELEEKLKPQKTKVDQQIQERQLRRQQTAPELQSTQGNLELHLQPGASVDSSASFMDELKQRLSKICVSSNFEVDRIVKESKTTTITESRETIHFRPPEEEKPTRASLPPGTSSKRLSIRAPTDLEARQDPPLIYVNISESNEDTQKPKVSSPRSTDSPKPKRANGTGLYGEYVQLEEEINDINKRNRELKKKFFTETKSKETPILSSSSPREAGDKPPVRKSPTTSSALPPQPLLSVPPLPGSVKKTTGCAFNILK